MLLLQILPACSFLLIPSALLSPPPNVVASNPSRLQLSSHPLCFIVLGIVRMVILFLATSPCGYASSSMETLEEALSRCSGGCTARFWNP
jgi:hypothetical protein